MPTASGTASWSASSAMTITATSHIDLGALWGLYMQLKVKADTLTELWTEVMASGGLAAGAATYYSASYQAHEAADAMFRLWTSKWQQVNPAPPSGPDPLSEMQI